MARVDEKKAAEAFFNKLSAGEVPLERAKNDGVNYSEDKEERDTSAVRESTKSKLFEQFIKLI